MGLLIPNMYKRLIQALRLDSTVNVPIWNDVSGVVVQMFRIAVTGTPGTGKTSLCEFADVERMSVLELAERHATASFKESGAPVEIDIPHLYEILER